MRKLDESKMSSDEGTQLVRNDTPSVVHERLPNIGVNTEMAAQGKILDVRTKHITGPRRLEGGDIRLCNVVGLSKLNKTLLLQEGGASRRPGGSAPLLSRSARVHRCDSRRESRSGSSGGIHRYRELSVRHAQRAGVRRGLGAVRAHRPSFGLGVDARRVGCGDPAARTPVRRGRSRARRRRRREVSPGRREDCKAWPITNAGSRR